MLASFLTGEFLLRIPARAGLFLIWGVFLTHPVLAVVLPREFLLHIPCWLISYLGSFSYTSRAGYIFLWGVSLLLLIWGVSLSHPVLASFLSGEFLLHIPCCLHFMLAFCCCCCCCLGSFSHTPLLFSFLFWGVSLTRPVLASFLTEEFLLHIPCCLHFYLGSFSHTSRAAFILCWLFFLSGDFSHTSRAVFIFILGSVPYTSRAGFIFNWGVSLTHPMLASFLPGEFLFHIPRWLYFSVGCFSYTSHADFFIYLNFKFGEFLLHIPCWLHFYLGSFCYTVSAGFIFYLESFCCTSRLVLAYFLYGVFLLHIPCWL